jgi:hypothetical protein
MGNCEESLGWSRVDCGCGFEEGTACAALAVDWYAHADRALGDDACAWMHSLPRRLDVAIGTRRLAVVHGSVASINGFVFASTPWADKEREIAAGGCHGVGRGHSGLPFTQAQNGSLWHNSGARPARRRHARASGTACSCLMARRPTSASCHSPATPPRRRA